MTTWTRCLATEDIDILSIATSDHTHAELGITAIEAGIPMVFCEKPMTTSLEDADALVGAVEDAGTAFSVDHTRRWDPFFRQAYDFIQSGRIGRVVRVVGTWGGTRALEYRNGSHTVDAVNMYAGGSPQWAVGVHEPPGRVGGASTERPGAIRQRGVLAFINQTKAMPKFTEWQVFGEQGRVRIGGVHSTVEYAATTPSGPGGLAGATAADAEGVPLGDVVEHRRPDPAARGRAGDVCERANRADGGGGDRGDAAIA